MSEPVQIDPPGCGCTECLTGEYVPLDQASKEQVAAMLAGKLSNATSEVFDMTIKVVDITDHLKENSPVVTTVRSRWSGMEWSWHVSKDDVPR